MSYHYNLGTHHRPITTGSTEAQQWFNRGLIWIYGFDLEMAGRCFQQAIDLDDDSSGSCTFIGPSQLRPISGDELETLCRARVGTRQPSQQRRFQYDTTTEV